MAVDFDADACDSYERNLGHRPIQLDVRDLLRMAEASCRFGPIDLLVADPPCTPWSHAGKRLGTDDERDMLVDTVALIRALRPQAWLIANVPGLDDGPNWPIVQATIGSLARDYYCIDFARLDAADYGVPQHRVRPFWFGHSCAHRCIDWPARTHGSPKECHNESLPGMAALRPWVTCREALSHLSAEELGSPVRLRWRGCKGKQIASVPDRPARVVGTSTLSDGNVLAHPTEAVRDRRAARHPGRKARASHLDEPAGVVTCKDHGGDGCIVFDGPDHRPSRADAPARTLTRNTYGDGALLVNERHPINRPDEPSFTVTTKGDGRGAQGACVVEWPWDRPATVVHGGDRLAPPGHHEKSFLSDNRGHGPNAVKISEKAAAILQGFPEGWTFAGATKRARWAQIGMAMPPPLAEAVGRSIARVLRAREAAAE
jgi:DNA (cytosine-5)-methyltransferase 1